MFTKGHTKKWSKKDNSPRNPRCFQAGKPSGRSRSQTSIQIPESASASTSYVRQNLLTAKWRRLKKWGTCCQFTLKCIACGFIGDRMKMYKEIANGKAGPNPGKPNVALASALQDCPRSEQEARCPRK
ncbi:Hypothetical predicted protein [Mytilus galloprovincialis]|uniref:Mutator-like transposase domain-containing protein n=1 Tax=Mytilus galloprovincialis TaxID=29158 RepID=A0A8B6FLT8_MYTGA|nr:Hypothetical predicted protein [Mytilus galloprovincialis]